MQERVKSPHNLNQSTIEKCYEFKDGITWVITYKIKNGSCELTDIKVKAGQDGCAEVREYPHTVPEIDTPFSKDDAKEGITSAESVDSDPNNVMWLYGYGSSILPNCPRYVDFYFMGKWFRFCY